jgi:hypothetical protein
MNPKNPVLAAKSSPRQASAKIAAQTKTTTGKDEISLCAPRGPLRGVPFLARTEKSPHLALTDLFPVLAGKIRGED